MISLRDSETYLKKNGMVVLNTFLGLVRAQWGEIILRRSIPNLMQLHFHEILLKYSCSDKIL
jgi:hypothetical protein